MKYLDSVILDNLNLQQTGEALNNSSMKILFVIDREGILRGSITDGDIRRAIMRGTAPSDSVTLVLNPDPVFLKLGASATQIQSKLIGSRSMLVPVLDQQNMLVDIISTGLASRSEWHDMPVVVMAGGLGVRMRPLTENVPKPMLELKGKPILEHILNHAIDCGFRKFIFSVNYKASIIKEYFGQGENFGVDISYLDETAPLGTGGSLAMLKKAELPQTFLVMNGDVITGLNYGQLVGYHIEHDALATMAVFNYSHTVPFGVVDVANEGFVELLEKPTYSYFINAGIYAINKQCIDLIPRNEYFSLPDLFHLLKKNKQKSVVFPIQETWRDIGTIDEYEKAKAGE